MQNSLTLAYTLYEESKFWSALIGGLWLAFRGINWIRAIRTNDLHHIQLGVNELKTGLEKQTAEIVTELRELRDDFRAFYLPRPRTPRRKSSPKRRAI
jgi:hypothetical protein